MSDFNPNRFSYRRGINTPNELPRNKFGHTILNSSKESDNTEIEKINFTIDPEGGLQAGISILDNTKQVIYNWLENMKDEPDDNPQKQALMAQLALIEEEEKNDSKPKISNEILDSKPSQEFIDKITGVTTETNIFDDDTDDINDYYDTYDVTNADDTDDTYQVDLGAPRVKKFLPITNEEDDVDQIVYRKTSSIYNEMTQSTVRDNTRSKKCIKCDYEMPSEAKFCPECGSAQVVKHCSECGYKFAGNEKFCPDCGTHR